MEWAVYFIIAAFVAGLVYYLSLSQNKGKFGELTVSAVVGKTEEDKQYVINDLILAGENGKSSQIDHVVINGGGIWVIETKNYSGRIYGEDHQQTWTQVLANGKSKNKFYNPVKQNYTHMLAVEKALIENGEQKQTESSEERGTGFRLPMHSVVVFLKGNIQYIKSDYVVPVFSLKNRLRSAGDNVLDREQQKRYYEKLLSLRERQISAEEHVKNVREEQFRIENNICPRCGRTLVLKHGKYGDFYGCPGYPGCKFTKKADGKTGTDAGERK